MLLYCPNEHPQAQNLESVANAVNGPWQVDEFGSFGELQEYLTLPLSRPDTAVFAVSSRNELEQLVSLKDSLEDSRVIIILPDGDDATVRLAIKLRPSFFTIAGGDLSAVRAVLEKIASLSPKNAFAKKNLTSRAADAIN